MQVRSCNQRYFFKPTTNLRMKLALKRNQEVFKFNNKSLHDYLNVDVTTDISIFNLYTCFNGTSVNETFLVRSSICNFFTTIFELGSTIIFRIND